METYTIIGLMSGTSVDGLDLALCNFFKENEKWQYKVLKSATRMYDIELRHQMQNLHKLSISDLRKADINFGIFTANAVNKFLENEDIKVDLIASHGHTVLHEPEKGFTLQIGDGNTIAKRTGINTAYDFRSGDIALNGQGAPLVPIGDELLFGEYDACLNIGGFSNISMKNKNNKRIAFDISPVNIVLNKYAQNLGLQYDNNGEIAKSGQTIELLLEELNSIEFYRQNAPKSLGREWVESTINPILKKYERYETKDILNTFTIHTAAQIGKALDNCDKVLVTGGGAYNKFLISKIKEFSNTNIIIPSNEIVNFKEAIIFAFLGLLRLRNENNCLASITGASKDSCCGVIAIA